MGLHYISNPIIRTSLGVEALHKCDVLDNQKLEFLSWEMRIVYQNKLVGNEDKKQFGLEIPYDLYFPSVQEKLKNRCCKKCKKYHASVKSLKLHNKVCKVARVNRKRDYIDSSDSDEDIASKSTEADSDDDDDYISSNNVVSARPSFSVSVQDGFIENILNLKEWFKSPWILEDENQNI